jgi:hypothetical protein
MTRQQERGLTNALVFVVAGILVYLGIAQGWRINLLPAQYLGYFVAGLGALSLAGVNIWFHGNLDPKNDSATNAGQPHSGRMTPDV